LVRESKGIEHVKESIQQILGTPIGTRIMRPDFGSGLRQIVFELNEATIDSRGEHYVREATGPSPQHGGMDRP
jgi:phage baseplate assembly protein W